MQIQDKEIERVIEEVSHSFSVERLVVSDAEKNEARQMLRGEVSMEELIAFYKAGLPNSRY